MRRSGSRFATSIGAWINFALLLWFAARRDLLVIDDRLKASAGKLAIAGIALAVALFAGARVIPGWFAGWPTLRAEIDARAARGPRRRSSISASCSRCSAGNGSPCSSATARRHDRTFSDPE